MQYYKVLEKYDFKSRIYKGKKHNYVYGYFKSGELLTKKEFLKLANSPFIFEVVNINKNNTHKIYVSSLNEYKRFIMY